MTAKTKRNIYISLVLVLLYFAIGHLFIRSNLNPEWGYFFLLLYADYYSLTFGTVTIIVVLSTKKYWNSIPFITSCAVNAIECLIPLMWLVNAEEGMSLTVLLLFSTPPILFIIQLILFFINLKHEKLFIAQHVNQLNT